MRCGMSQERVNLPDLDYKNLEPEKKTAVRNAVVEIFLTEIQYAKDIHLFVTGMEQWLKERENETGANKITEEEAIFLRTSLKSLKELYTIDPATNTPCPLLLQDPDAFKLAYDLETFRTETNKKAGENDQLENVIERTSVARLLAKADKNKLIDEKIPDLINYLSDHNVQVLNTIEKQGHFISVYPGFLQFLQQIKSKYPDTFTINKGLSTEVNLLEVTEEIGQNTKNLLVDYPIKPTQRLARYDILYRALQDKLDPEAKNPESKPKTKQDADFRSIQKNIMQATINANSKKLLGLTEGLVKSFFDFALDELKKMPANLEEVKVASEMITKFKNRIAIDVEQPNEIIKRMDNMSQADRNLLSRNEQIFYQMRNNPALAALKNDYYALIAAEQKHANLLAVRSSFEAFNESYPLLIGKEFASQKAVDNVLADIDKQIKLSEENIKTINKKRKTTKKSFKKELKTLPEINKKAKKSLIGPAVNQANAMILNERNTAQKTAADKIRRNIEDYQKKKVDVENQISITKGMTASRLDFDSLSQISIPAVPAFKFMVEKWAGFDPLMKVNGDKYHTFFKDQLKQNKDFEQLRGGLSHISMLNFKLRTLTALEKELDTLTKMQTDINFYTDKVDLFSDDRKHQVKKLLSSMDKDGLKIGKFQSEIKAEKKKIRKEMEQEVKKLNEYDQAMIKQRRNIIADMPCTADSKKAVRENTYSAKDKIYFLFENIKTELNEVLQKYEANKLLVKSESKNKEELAAATLAKTVLLSIENIEKTKGLGAREKLDKLNLIFKEHKLSENTFTKDIESGFNASYETIKEDFKVQRKALNKERIEMKHHKPSLPKTYSLDAIQASLNAALQNYKAIIENLNNKNEVISEHKMEKNNARIKYYQDACKELEILINCCQSGHHAVHTSPRHEMIEKIRNLQKQQDLPKSVLHYLTDLKSEIKKHVELEKNLHEKHKQGAGLFDKHQDKQETSPSPKVTPNGKHQ